MARKAEQNKISSSSGRIMMEHNVAYDDSLLPPSSELRSLKEIEPEVVKWIMARTEVEQNARIDYNRKSQEITQKKLNGTFALSLLGVVLVFALVVIFMVISYMLIIGGYPLCGSIFGTGDLLMVGMILWKMKHNTQNK